MRSLARFHKAVSTHAIKLREVAVAWCTTMRHTSSRARTEGTFVRALRDALPLWRPAFDSAGSRDARHGARAHDVITILTTQDNENDN
jgi:hypothetical protein